MADINKTSKVGNDIAATKFEKLFIGKAESLNSRKGKQLSALKGKNKLVGLVLTGSVIGIYAYTMLSVKQTKLMEAFDKVPE